MSENLEALGGQEQAFEDSGLDLFDPDNAKVTTALSGRKGVIQRGSAFIRHNYGGKIADMANALQITVVSPELEKPRRNLIGTGALVPGEKVGEHPDGRPKVRPLPKNVLIGNFIAGGALEKRSNFYDFLTNLKASGFPMAELSQKGAAALDGAAFIWKALEKRQGRDVKVYDVPSEFLGFEEVGAAEDTGDAVVTGDATVAASVAPAAAPEVSKEEVKRVVAEAVVRALAKNNGAVPKSQLSIRVGPELKDYPRKGDALAFLLDDSFIASIPGVTYDNKIVRLQDGASTAGDVAATAPTVETKVEAVEKAGE
jgi:hypothetical protein